MAAEQAIAVVLAAALTEVWLASLCLSVSVSRVSVRVCAEVPTAVVPAAMLTCAGLF